MENELNKTLADIRQHRNCLGLAPGYVGSHCLPDEILSIVFENVLQPVAELFKSSFRDLYSAMEVCRRWKRVALHTARLWRYFDLDAMPYDVITTWTTRCSHVPLHVFSSDANCLINFCSDHPNFSRQVASLTLRKGWHTAPDHHNLVDSGTFPNLVNLHVELYPRTGRLYIPPSITSFAHLRVLHTDCPSEFWIKHPFPIGIEDLSLHVPSTDALSSPHLADAIRPLQLLCRFRLEFDGTVMGTVERRLRLPALEYVEFVLEPSNRRKLLGLLPTFRSRPYHLLIREPRRLTYTAQSQPIQSPLEDILSGQAHAFSTVRFVLGTQTPMMHLEGDARCSLSIQEHHPFGLRFADTLQLLHLPTIREVVISEPSLERCDTSYDLSPALCLFHSVERLVIHRCVGEEASGLLTNLAGPGARFVFPTSIKHRSLVRWPTLSYVRFQDIDRTFFRHTSFQPVQALGLVLWAMKTTGLPIDTVHVTTTQTHLSEFPRWREFIPNVVVEGDVGPTEVLIYSFVRNSS